MLLTLPSLHSNALLLLNCSQHCYFQLKKALLGELSMNLTIEEIICVLTTFFPERLPKSSGNTT